METAETQANERERDKKTILYKKQLRKLLPKNSWFSAGCYTTLNDLTRKDLETILKIALIEANKQQRKTIRSSDIRTAHKELGKLNSGDFIEKIETAINSRLREIREVEKQKKEVLLNGN
jgi:histone H3/H4